MAYGVVDAPGAAGGNSQVEGVTAEQQPAGGVRLDVDAAAPLGTGTGRLRARMAGRARVLEALGAQWGAGTAQAVAPALLASPASIVLQPWAFASWSSGVTGATANDARDRWFATALDLIRQRCVGFDPAQVRAEDAARGAAIARRFPLRLLSPTCQLLELRYPLGPVARIAQFLIDTEHPDVPVEPMADSPAPLSARWAAGLERGVAAPADDVGAVADFARIYCRYLEADGGQFIPCEDRHDPLGLGGRFLGDLPAEIMAEVQPWRRLTRAEGAVLDGMRLHLFNGLLTYDQGLFAATLAVVVVADAPKPEILVRMIDEERVALPDEIDGRAPMVPARRDVLTHACYPLRIGPWS